MPDCSETAGEHSDSRHWADLSPFEQLELREAFGRYLDGLPPTCSMEIKIERFQRWLADRSIDYSAQR